MPIFVHGVPVGGSSLIRESTISDSGGFAGSRGAGACAQLLSLWSSDRSPRIVRCTLRVAEFDVESGAL